MSPVDSYIQQLQNTHQQHIMLQVHHFLMTYEGVTCKLRFNIPFYDGNKWICYLNPIKKNGVELCFLKGFQLSPRMPLQAGKRTMVKGIKLFHIDEKQFELIASVFEEALLLDQALKA